MGEGQAFHPPHGEHVEPEVVLSASTPWPPRLPSRTRGDRLRLRRVGNCALQGREQGRRPWSGSQGRMALASRSDLRCPRKFIRGHVQRSYCATTPNHATLQVRLRIDLRTRRFGVHRHFALRDHLHDLTRWHARRALVGRGRGRVRAGAGADRQGSPRHAASGVDTLIWETRKLHPASSSPLSPRHWRSWSDGLRD